MALPRHLSPISGIDREAIMGDLSLGGKRTSDARLARWRSAGLVALSWSGGAQLVRWRSAGPVALSWSRVAQLVRWRSAGSVVLRWIRWCSAGPVRDSQSGAARLSET